MGRPKLFNREDVLHKAMPVFWVRGYADTCMQDLEKATGVNKSGLYSEFKDKDDIFIESLRYYYSTRASREILKRDPFGWDNIETYLKDKALRLSSEQKGCFGVNTMRELERLPSAARELIIESRQNLKKLWLKNIAAEKTKLPPESITELLSTFYSGICIEQHMPATTKASQVKRINDFMTSLRCL